MSSDELEDEKVVNFHEMGLDDRVLKAIARLGWDKPTLIQEKAIPLALQGKDILARARTGSGKTAAYAIPIIQKILTTKQFAKEQCIKAVVLAPTKELCSQAFRNIKELCSSCSREVRCVDVSGKQNVDTQKSLLLDNPDIVIGTPSRLLAHINAKHVDLKKSVEMIVIDEADLLFSFGYEEDMKSLLVHLPKIYQAFLMSATLSEDVKSLKKLVLHNPVTLKLEEAQLPACSQLIQCHLKCEEEDKFVLIYALLKLKLIRGKIILFVNTVDRCYRVKLFLEQFGIRSCVLNSELPVSSRCHIVNQFNTGLYDIIIAADELSLENPGVVKQDSSKHKKLRDKDRESGVSRGIDFRNVANVINFDFPLDANSYVHRVGRTARGDSEGTALSFVSVKEMDRLTDVQKHLSNGGDEEVIKPYLFKMEEIEGLRYRAKDAMKAVTRYAIREARLKEIKDEILNSKKLKTYFEDNPRDLQVLRHDKCLHTAKVQPHLKNMPEYLVPQKLRHLHGIREERRGRRNKRGGGGQESWSNRPSKGLDNVMADSLCNPSASVTEPRITEPTANPQKKAGRFVPSRYLLPKGSMKATDLVQDAVLQTSVCTAGAHAAGFGGSIVAKCKPSLSESLKVSNHGKVAEDKRSSVGGGGMKGRASLRLCSTADKAEKEVTQNDIELAFGRQCQWAFLASLAKKTFHEQEKNAMVEIQALWEAVEDKKKQVNDLRSELSEINYHSNLKEMLQLQISSVTSIESQLVPLCDKYTDLVTHIMDMSNQLKTKGVYIPPDRVKYLDEMRAVISESYQLLAQLLGTINQSPSVNSYARSLQSLNDIVNDTLSKMSRNNELLSAVRSLSTRETSLRIQQMHIQ